MTNLDIETFWAVVQHGTMTAAAEALYITQPSLSARLKALEEEMGCRLVLRSKGQRSVELTRQGEEFISVAGAVEAATGGDGGGKRKGAFCRSHRHQRKHLRPSAGRVLAAIHRTASGKEDTDKGVRLQRHV